MGFALGKSLHDIQEYDDAFKAYEIGNIAILLEKLKLKLSKESIERIKTIYSNKEEKIYIDTNHQNVNPIFIVGMNRSGTTLVEQILSSHSTVTGAGELPNINKLGLENLKTNIKWTKTELICARAEYSKVLGSFAQGTKFVTDKLPVNFKWIGPNKNTLSKGQNNTFNTKSNGYLSFKLQKLFHSNWQCLCLQSNSVVNIFLSVI